MTVYLRICLLLAGLSSASAAGCSKHSDASAPLTPEQLEQQTKQVEQEERAHFEQLRASGASPGQGR